MTPLEEERRRGTESSLQKIKLESGPFLRKGESGICLFVDFLSTKFNDIYFWC